MHSESFKDELAAAIRAVSGDESLDVQFRRLLGGGAPTARYAKTAHQLDIALPDELDRETVRYVRGITDREALKLRHHDETLHQQLRRESGQASMLDRLEEVRYASLGAEKLNGVGHNIGESWLAEWQLAGWVDEPSVIPAQELIALSLFASQHKQALPDALRTIAESYGCSFTELYHAEYNTLHAQREDQRAYAKTVEQLAHRLMHGEDAEPEDSPDAEGKDELKGEQLQQGEAEESPDEGSELETLRMEDRGEQGEAEEQNKKGRRATDRPEELQDDTGASDPSHNPARPDVNSDNVLYVYSAYTTQFDRVERAEDMLEIEELRRLRHELDHKLHDVKDVTHRMAMKLQRLLLATQLRTWDYHMEEGILDPSKLPQLIVDPSYLTPYKWERSSPYKHTVVSLLIDNSGSMRGRPIMMAAMCADILSRVLERCGVKVEVLGFTTAEWKGGKSRKKWLEHGSPPAPGRLNDVQHIIYKSADLPYRKARANLALMLKETILKENIDGEAILWAYERLLNRPEERKILMVISDGAPVDDATLSSNPGNYLDQHLRQVIHSLEKDHLVELLAIGIGHDVTNYYSHAVKIDHVEALADAMVSELTQLFDEDMREKRRKAKTR